ncbi:MAG: VanZ family protein [Noviherbaspirillum sp.]
MRLLLMRLIADERNETFMFRSAFLIYLAVLVFGSIPGAREEIGEVASGLVLHFVTYAGIAFFLFCGVGGNASRKAFATFVIIALMGAFDEFLQSFFPYRTAAMTDWCVDVGAGLFASALLWKVSLSNPDAPPAS